MTISKTQQHKTQSGNYSFNKDESKHKKTKLNLNKGVNDTNYLRIQLCFIKMHKN